MVSTFVIFGTNVMTVQPASVSRRSMPVEWKPPVTSMDRLVSCARMRWSVLSTNARLRSSASRSSIEMGERTARAISVVDGLVDERLDGRERVVRMMDEAILLADRVCELGSHCTSRPTPRNGLAVS